MLVSKGRLGLTLDVQDWINLAVARAKTILLPLTPQIAVQSTRLDKPVQGDPADRLTIAFGLAFQSQIVSKDKLIRQQSQVQVIW